MLLAHVLGTSRASVLAHGDRTLDPDERRLYARLIASREEGVPVAYLRGSASWLDLELEVTPDVLVPRPETELLVELAVQEANRRGARMVLDIGTGSGAIAVALARALPHCEIQAADLSSRALLVAYHNVRRYGVLDRVELLPGDLLEPVSRRPDLIVANLPYLSDSMMAELEVDVRQEPQVALHGGSTGLELYARLFRMLVERGWFLPILAEIDPRQADAMMALATTIFPRAAVRLQPDLTGRPRVAIVEPEADA